MKALQPLPPFTAETAAQKARMAEDGWNRRDPARVALAYTANSHWRNRSEFFEGREAIAPTCSALPECTGADHFAWPKEEPSSYEW